MQIGAADADLASPVRCAASAPSTTSWIGALASSFGSGCRGRAEDHQPRGKGLAGIGDAVAPHGLVGDGADHRERILDPMLQFGGQYRLAIDSLLQFGDRAPFVGNVSRDRKPMDGLPSRP